MNDPFTVAVVQRPPVLLDRSATLKHAIDHRTLDVAGHYGRPDVFHLTIDRTAHEPIAFEDEA